MSSRRARLDLEIGVLTTGEQLFQVRGELLSWHLLLGSLRPTQSHLGLKTAHTPGMSKRPVRSGLRGILLAFFKILHVIFLFYNGVWWIYSCVF